MLQPWRRTPTADSIRTSVAAWGRNTLLTLGRPFWSHDGAKQATETVCPPWMRCPSSHHLLQGVHATAQGAAIVKGQGVRGGGRLA